MPKKRIRRTPAQTDPVVPPVLDAPVVPVVDTPAPTDPIASPEPVKTTKGRMPPKFSYATGDAQCTGTIKVGGQLVQCGRRKSAGSTLCWQHLKWQTSAGVANDAGIELGGR